jgi:hypothetical protein
MDNLTPDDWSVIIEALEYSKRAKAEYREYPSEEFRSKQLARVDEVLAKAREARASSSSTEPR